MTDAPEFDSELHRTALAQLDRVAARLELDADIHERLRYPRRALVVSVPVRMDDGRHRGLHRLPGPPQHRARARPRAACATTSTSTWAR